MTEATPKPAAPAADPPARSPRPLTPEAWAMIERVAPAMHQARFFGGVTSPAAAAAIMLTGYELGLPLAASFRFVHVVDGRPSLSPKGALAVLRRSGLLEGMELAEAPGACTVTMRRRGGEAYTLTWTLDDARRAGVVRPNGGWERYPQNMLRWRTIGYVADVLFPDVLGGLHRADEFGAPIDASGDVVRQSDGEADCGALVDPWASQPAQPLWPAAAGAGGPAGEADEDAVAEAPATAPTPPAPPVPAPTRLDDLVDLYGADDVLTAAGGTIPATEDDVAAVAERLRAGSEAGAPVAGVAGEEGGNHDPD
jgi:hypothetical protein